MGLNQAARYYGINKGSLHRRVSGQTPIHASVVAVGTVLSSLEEAQIAECIKLFAEWGWGLTAKEVQDLVRDYVVDTCLETPFIGDRPGYDWMAGFLKRNSDIVPRKTEHLSQARAMAENADVIKHWFSLLDKILTKYDVKDKPAQIFNTDESGFVTDPKASVVLARKGSKRVGQVIGGSGRAGNC